MMIIPIFHHTETKIECIVQNNKTYCEDKAKIEKADVRDVGYFLLIALIFVAILTYGLDREWNGYLLAAIALTPFILGALLMIFS